MAQEDHSQRHSNSSSGGGGGSGGGVGGGGYDHHHRYSKKLKRKKVPQRGLGVAQLEKIRLEEEQKNDVSSSVLPPSNSIISPSNSSNCLTFRPTMSQPPLPPPCPNNLTFSPSSVPFSVAMNSGGGEIGWLVGGLDQRGGFDFMTNVRLPYESNTPTWPLPNVVQERSQQFQQSSSSMVNVSTGTSSASVLNFQMEPPSNQSFCGNNNFTPPLWPEEDKMVGMKRSYPYVLEDIPILEFPCKLSSFVPPISRSDESASCSNGGGKNSIEPSYPVIREGFLNPRAILPRPKKFGRENGGGLNGDFLTLALPETHSTKLSLQCQEDNPISDKDGSIKQQTFISFFPPAKTDTGLAISHRRSSNGETGDCVDLNLKL